MAAVIFNQLAAQSGLDYVAESAGVAAVGDRPASENAVKLAHSGAVARFVGGANLPDGSRQVRRRQRYSLCRTP